MIYLNIGFEWSRVEITFTSSTKRTFTYPKERGGREGKRKEKKTQEKKKRLLNEMTKKGIKLPSAIFELDVHDQTQKPDQTDKDEKLLLEFDRDELQKLYLQLEVIQDSLDSVG